MPDLRNELSGLDWQPRLASTLDAVMNHEKLHEHVGWVSAESSATFALSSVAIPGAIQLSTQLRWLLKQKTDVHQQLLPAGRLE